MVEIPDETSEVQTKCEKSFFAKHFADSGSHAPSPETLKQCFPDLELRVDACFPINPYATQLFCDFFQREIIETGKLGAMLRSYPPQNHKLSELVAERLNMDENYIFLGNGATEIIQAVLNHYIGKKILVNLPTFSSYYEFIPERSELIINRLKKEEDFQLDFDHLLDVIENEDIDTVVLINPNNPDGNFLPPVHVKALLEYLEDLETVIVDESFIDFACPPNEDPLKYSVMPYCEQFENLIIIKSMSKDMGIAGVRAGYAVMKPKKITNLLESGFLWNISGLAAYFFQLYARDDYYEKYRRVRKDYIENTHAFFKVMENFPSSVKVYKSQTNFTLMEMLDGQTSSEFTENLLFDQGVYVRDCSDKWGLEGEFIRIAAGTREENDIVLEALKENIAA